jgi:hypothetical protein
MHRHVSVALVLLNILSFAFGLSSNPHMRKALQARKSHLISSTWYPGWRAPEFPPEDLDWKKYDVVTYAVAYVWLFPLVLQFTNKYRTQVLLRLILP